MMLTINRTTHKSRALRCSKSAVRDELRSRGRVAFAQLTVAGREEGGVAVGEDSHNWRGLAGKRRGEGVGKRGYSRRVGVEPLRSAFLRYGRYIDGRLLP